MKEYISKKIEDSYYLYIFFFNIYNYTFWFLNGLTNFYFEKKDFLSKQGYEPNLQHSSSFNELILKKKISNKKTLLTRTADKYKVRSYVKEVLDDGVDYLVPLLEDVKTPKNISFDALPSTFIIKANHASGRNRIIRDNDYNKENLISDCRKWIKTPYGLSKIERCYKDIERRIIIEELLQDEQGNIPNDYKFFILNGTCQLIQVDIDRFGEHRRVLYQPSWERLDVTLKYKKGDNIEKPQNLQKMIHLAEELGKPFKLVRIDLYSINGNIYFGEITHYPGSGKERFKPQSFDYKLGRLALQ